MLLLLAVLLVHVLHGQDWDGWLASALAEERLGHFPQAEAMLRKAIVAAARTSENHRALAVIENNLGGVLVSQGRYVQAEKILKRALAHFQADSGGGTDWTAALNHLATIYRERGRLRESEEAYRRVLTARLASPETSKHQIARSRANLAALLLDRQRFDEARELLDAALSSFPPSSGMDLDRGTILMNLAVLHTLQSDLKRARMRAEQGVSVLEALPVDHPALGKALLTLGCILMKDRLHEAAAERLAEAVRILRLGFARHPIFVEALAAYAGALSKCGRQKEAKQARQESASIRATDETHHTVNVSELRIEGKR
ncbi:MAG: tetratricopeptide repeat protein [Bryobacteraceae bacterium]